MIHFSAGPESQGVNVSGRTVPNPDSPVSPAGEDHSSDDLSGLENPGIHAGIMIPSRTDPVFVDGYNAMNDFLINFRTVENNDVPHPSLSAAVRFHGKAVPIPENRFHAPAGVGDGLNRIPFHSFESDAQYQNIPTSCKENRPEFTRRLSPVAQE